MHIRAVVVPEWPRLAWLAVCPQGLDAVTCFVGRNVETADDWFCEGVWAGPFDEGAVDETDLVFGSGARVRGDQLIFVSAGSTLDRLHSLHANEADLVSNSLPCLLSVTGGSLQVRSQEYGKIFHSVQAGLRNYTRDLPTTVGPARLTYFDNLLWDGDQLTPTAKPFATRDFSSYAKYRTFLDASMAALAANAAAPERRHPFGLISTLSSGYDSSAVTVLARQAGCHEAFGFDRGRLGFDDNGAGVAERLGLCFHSLKTFSAPNADVSFLASGAGHGGDVVFKSAEAFLEGRVVFTGFHGDKMWDKHTQHLGPDIVRGDTSGSDLAEYRLSVGFANCPVPFWGVRQIKDVHAISNSAEMAPWDVGKTYSRPICRRIVEECGVPRTEFGMRKRGVFQSIPGPANFLTPELRRDYFRWLRTQQWAFIRAKQVPPTRAADAMIRGASRLGAALNRRRSKPLVTRLGPRADRVLGALAREIDLDKRRRLHGYVIHWAVDRGKENYPDPLRAQPERRGVRAGAR